MRTHNAKDDPLHEIRKISVKGKKRLLKLRELLLRNARRKRGVRFDQFEWGVSDTEEFNMDCGTSACALGLAAISCEFRRYGLGYTMERVYDHDYKFRLRFLYDGDHFGSFDNEFEMAAKVFDIPRSLSTLLFSGAGAFYDGNQQYRGAVAERALAKRIKDIVKRGMW